MGKYDHICELTGAENYVQWRRQMSLALKGERLWNQCSSGTDPNDLAEYASIKPTASGTITDEERDKILDWLSKDAQAKALIDRKISTIIASQLNETQTAREQWDMLSQRYSWNDLLSQYELRTRIRSEKLKDADDALRYLGVFEDARRRFIQMGVMYSDDEAIFDLLQGLPGIIEWQIFRELTMNLLSTSNPAGQTSSIATQTPTIPAVTFADVAKQFTEKANAIVGKRKLAGPGSEYANVALIHATTNPKVNPATGIRITRNNPKGIRCSNSHCADQSRAENHDLAHCYWPGGGMESRAPDWVRAKLQKKTETAPVAMVVSF